MMNRKKIEFLEEDIAQAKNILTSTNKKDKLIFIERVTSAWNKDRVNIQNGLVEYIRYRNDMIDYECRNHYEFVSKPSLSKYNLDEDLKQLIKNLEMLKEESANHKNSTKANASSVTLNNYNNVSVIITLDQTIGKINDTKLSEHEIAEIKKMLDDIEKTKKNKTKTWEKVKNIMAWLADKAVDVGIAVLPYLAGIIAK